MGGFAIVLVCDDDDCLMSMIRKIFRRVPVQLSGAAHGMKKTNPYGNLAAYH